MYVTELARKRVRAQRAAERRKQRPSKIVYLGKTFDLWNQTKCTTGITSDIEFAKCLLDRLVISYYSASIIFTLFQYCVCLFLPEINVFVKRET